MDGKPYDPSAEGVFVTNTISSSQTNRDQWRQVDSVVQPNGVAIAKPLSYNGSQPCHVRRRRLADGDFEYKLEEWKYLDGTHINETIHTLATESGEHELQLSDGTPYRVKTGRVSVQTDFVTVSLDDFFGTERPVVLAQAQTFNGTDPIVTRLRYISSSSFDVRVQEQENLGEHTFSETIGYSALQQATGQINNTPFEVQRTERTVTDGWSRITFQQEYNTPQFIAGLQSFNGTDTAHLRYRNLTSTGVDVKAEEERSVDTELNHAPEAVGYAVFECSV